MERDQEAEGSAHHLLFRRSIWFYFLLLALNRMDYGIPELQTEEWTASFQVRRA